MFLLTNCDLDAIDLGKTVSSPPDDTMLPILTEILAVPTCSIILLYAYLRCKRGKCQSKADLSGKTIIITGATGGIGFYTALDLAWRNARVIMTGRDPGKLKRAVAEVKWKTGNSEVLAKVLDVSLVRSIRSFVEDFRQTERRLDILINNAGIGGWNRDLTRTEEGLEVIMATNHLGHFLLTNLLLDMLASSGQGRVINVSSCAHKPVSSRLDLNNINSQLYYDNWNAYGNTKLCNILHARELAKRMQGKGVTAYSLHPGIVKTDIWRQAKTPLRCFIKLSSVFLKASEEGAQTTVHCAVEDGIERHSGGYFEDCRLSKPHAVAEDDEAARNLWDVSEEILKGVQAKLGTSEGVNGTCGISVTQ